MRVITSNDQIISRRTRLEDLEARLNHGDAIIRQLESEQKPVDHLVRHWLELLSEYEAEFHSVQSAA